MSFQKLQGIRLFYEISGRGQPLLFIHGLGSNSRDWEGQVPFFAKRHRLIIPDLRGHGASDKPPVRTASRSLPTESRVTE